MMEDEIQTLLITEPFIPFRIKLINGDIHDVNAPGNVAILKQGLYIASQDGEWASSLTEVLPASNHWSFSNR